MELRALAEQILFGTTLEEKLQCPKTLTDDHPGIALAAPATPIRPRELQFKGRDSAAPDFPKTHQLESEVERGRLLHFFANHELLATELMALVLLKFPDAPAAFRQGILQTLRDEQIHTQLYLRRMREAGIHFGDLPVSGFFWRAVSTMESPLDYVSRLSLTFEQANLDFCQQFARNFEEMGDQKTARLLRRIHKDEIGHVAYGLKWFRRWKNPNETDWDAFCHQLKFPLSPQRAKGVTLNVESRLAAGLDTSFIAELNVFSQSKGRTPSVFVFNPFTEAFLAHGKSFSLKKHQTQLAEDLANIPQFLGRRDDIVLLHTRPSLEFLHQVKQAGIPLPEFVEINRGRIEGSILERKLGRLRPWAWGPDSLELLKPLFPNVTGETRTLDQRFNPRTFHLYSKAWSADFLRRLLADTAKQPWLCTEAEVGVAVRSLPEALNAIESIRRRGHHRVVAKEALGLAGHNSIRLWEPALLEKQRRWMDSVLREGRVLVIEPWVERAFDFSVQLEMTTAGLKVCGYTELINDLRGQYQGNVAAPNYQRHLPSQVADLLKPTARNAAAIILQLYDRIRHLLERELRVADYIGPVGIDCFIYRAADGVARLKPVVEINPRYTMGRLTLELMKHTCPGSHGVFRLIDLGMVRRDGFPHLAAYGAHLAERLPLSLEGSPVCKIRRGALCLNDPSQARVCLAVLQVT